MTTHQMHEHPRANKTDAGDGTKAICRASNVLRSPSPDRRRPPIQQHESSAPDMLASHFDSPALVGFSLFCDMICITGIAAVIFALSLACFFLPSLRGQFVLHSNVAMIAAALPWLVFIWWCLTGRFEPLSGQIAIRPAISTIFLVAIGAMRCRYRRSSPPLRTRPLATVILWAATVILPFGIYRLISFT